MSTIKFFVLKSMTEKRKMAFHLKIKKTKQKRKQEITDFRCCVHEWIFGIEHMVPLFVPKIAVSLFK